MTPSKQEEKKFDKPLWVQCIINDTAAYASLVDHVTTEVGRLNDIATEAILSGATDTAIKAAATKEAWRELLRTIQMYEREESEYVAFQEKLKGGRGE